jgi:soluble lytic murein transglycosylase-like protein
MTFGPKNIGKPIRLWMGLVVMISLALPSSLAAGEIIGSKSRTQLFKSQTGVLDTRANEQYNSAIRLAPPRVITPTKWGDGSYDGAYRGPFLDMARNAALKHGVPVDLFLKLVQQESGWNAQARSHKGAMGLAQLMPQTAAYLGVNPNVPEENLEGGARYLAEQYRAFRSWRLALAAYNAGPEAVKKYGGVPPFQETQNYVRIIWGS